MRSGYKLLYNIDFERLENNPLKNKGLQNGGAGRERTDDLGLATPLVML